MADTYWFKQEAKKPLFPDIIWSRPQNKHTSGKLLIAGGNLHGFSSVAAAYNSAQNAGAGAVRILIPDSLQKTVSKIFPEAIFCSSTPSGSFSQAALGPLLDEAKWADGVLIAGDLGRNSETAILLEKFFKNFRRQLTLSGDAVDYAAGSPGLVENRKETLLATTFGQLQKVAASLKHEKPLKSELDMHQLVEFLHDFIHKFRINLILEKNGVVYTAAEDKICTTPQDQRLSQAALAAAASVWWLQNPNKTFEALSSSIISSPFL